MKQSKTILFFGTDSFSAASLRHLIQAGFSIAAVVSQPDRKRGRGQQVQKTPVKVLAEAHDIPVWQPTDLLSILPDIRALQPVTGVLASFGRIIPQEFLDCFDPGIVNVHPSLLPKYRGPTPIETAILNGDTESGVSLMQLVAKMDAGPVYAQMTYPLDGTETQASLYDRFADYGGTLLVQYLPRIINDSLQPKPQDETHATYTSLLTKTDALPDPSVLSATQLERRVRPFQVFPKTKLTVYGQLVQCVAGHVGTAHEPLAIACANDSYYVIDRLVAPNGKTMSADDFIRGYAPTA